ncbi:GNAT family N-acetyltransferase [Saccharopolyspora sp. NPDC000359]|uniref:GNAT family N-acetyltransferase n=1 Tax=Saccharopolyspora sp. NPDC000359 TaxID=3154251 RepID=UPI003329051E
MVADPPTAAAPTEPESWEFRRVHVDDALAAPLLDELAREYSARYGMPLDEQVRKLAEEYPPEDFTPPGGALVLLLERGNPVAGGAFRRHDARTAELKRMWTRSGHRRRGLARRVLAELERQALASGYRRVHLTTGPRQPEAQALYLAAGYRPLFDTTRDPAELTPPLPFEKILTDPPTAEAT